MIKWYDSEVHQSKLRELFSEETENLEKNSFDAIDDQSIADERFDRILQRKCRVTDQQFSNLWKFDGQDYSQCYQDLKKWQEGLAQGDFLSQRMCDAWAEKTDFNNFPGLQNQKLYSEARLASLYFRRKKFGLADQCRSIKGQNDTGLEGQYAFVKKYAHGLQETDNIGDIIECLTECTDDCLDCLTDIKWLDYFTEEGRCYPSTCSSSQLLMAISRSGTEDLLLDTTYIGTHGQVAENKVLNLEYSVKTFTNTIDRVYLPTFISYCVFMGIILLFILIGSIRFSRNKSDNFTSIFASQIHWRKLTSTKRSSKVIKCIDGIRAFSMFWVVLGHFYTTVAISSGNINLIFEQMKTGAWSSIFYATVSVDSFFVIGGILLAYLSTEKIIKTFTTIRSFCTNYILFLVSRWMRLTPMVMATAWSIVTIFPVCADVMDMNLIVFGQRICEQDLWKSFFYLSGWLEGPSGFCNAVQWYLSNDFFYYALFPFIAYAYGRKRIIGVVLVIFGIMGSWGHNYWSSKDGALVGSPLISQTYRIYSSWPTDRKHDPYFPPWARYHSHGVGVLFGWLILQQRRSLTFTKCFRRRRLLKALVILVLWGISLTFLWLGLFGIDSCFRVTYKNEPAFGKLENADNIVERYDGCLTDGKGNINWEAVHWWNASYRIIWSVGLGILVFLCDLGYGYIINWFLCGRLWLFISRLSFCMYLLHYSIIGLWDSTIAFSFYSNAWTLVWWFPGFLVVVAAVAFVFHMLIEAPFGNAWGLVLRTITSNVPIKKERISLEKINPEVIQAEIENDDPEENSKL